MTKLKSLFEKAWTAVSNPGQNERVALLVAAIGRELQTKRGAFKLNPVAERLDCTTKDVEVATTQYYSKYLNRQWSAGVPTEGQRTTLAAVAKKLHLPPDHVTRMNTDVALTYFGAKLGSTLEDGEVSSEELAELSSISSFIGLTVPQLVQNHLAAQGIALLRGLFAEAVATGYLDKRTWRNLLGSAQQLGLSEQELTKAVGPMARTFAEHVLADVKSDSVLSEHEEAYLAWLIRTFDFDQTFHRYVRRELQILRERGKIRDGHVDTIAVPVGSNLSAGELLYLCQPSILRLTKLLKSGPRKEQHHGRLLCTDNRLVFESTTKSICFLYRNILSSVVGRGSIRVTVANKPEVQFVIDPDTEPLLEEKFTAILQLNSRTLRKKVDGQPDRHIPRSVRQRVWQIYGGRCVECNATDYLEFDHIVPVAKGGSNAEQNIQLLCRKCNLQKSDKI